MILCSIMQVNEFTRQLKWRLRRNWKPQSWVTQRWRLQAPDSQHFHSCNRRGLATKLPLALHGHHPPGVSSTRCLCVCVAECCVLDRLLHSQRNSQRSDLCFQTVLSHLVARRAKSRTVFQGHCTAVQPAAARLAVPRESGLPHLIWFDTSDLC